MIFSKSLKESLTLQIKSAIYTLLSNFTLDQDHIRVSLFSIGGSAFNPLPSTLLNKAWLATDLDNMAHGNASGQPLAK
jgi:hypothetical protein